MACNSMWKSSPAVALQAEAEDACKPGFLPLQTFPQAFLPGQLIPNASCCQRQAHPEQTLRVGWEQPVIHVRQLASPLDCMKRCLMGTAYA